jgi:hypothetical protein
MNNEFPPVSLVTPEIVRRRKEKSRRPIFDPDKLAYRAEKALLLNSKLKRLSEKLLSLSEDQRKAVFYKLEHERPLNLVGTDLKPIAENSEHFTLAIPRSGDLAKLISKIDEYGNATVENGHVPNEGLGAYLLSVSEGEPKDRLSEELYENYEEIINTELVICEIELFTTEKGVKKARNELLQIRKDLDKEFANGINGWFYMPCCYPVQGKHVSETR